MKILSTLLAIALFALASCSSDKTADTTETTTSTENTTTAPATGTAEVPAADPNMQAQPQMQTAQPAQQTSTDGAVALNPAHGQPGHRCDIAVGAPLNSAPAAQQPQTIQVQ